MRIEEKIIGDITILRLIGKLLHGEGIDRLREAIDSSLREGFKKIIFNIDEVPYIDTVGLGALLRSNTVIKKEGAEVVCCFSPKMRDLLSITRLLTVFKTFNSEESAIEWFKKKEPKRGGREKNPEIIEKEIRELLNSKNIMDYLEARSKMSELKEIQPLKFETLRNEFDFLFHQERLPGDDIHDMYRIDLIVNPSKYGAIITQKIKEGWMWIAFPARGFICFPKEVFDLISTETALHYEELEPIGIIEDRIKKLEQLFKLGLFVFMEEELRKNFDLIRSHAGVIPGTFLERNRQILKDYIGKFVDNAIDDLDEQSKPIHKFRILVNFILQWGECFAKEKTTEDKKAVPLKETKEKEVNAAIPLVIVNEPNSPYDKGEKLEKALFKLFQVLFSLNETHKINSRPKEITKYKKKKKEKYLVQKRWQESGIQYGYDLEFTWKEVFVSNKSVVPSCPEIKCCVECKHYSGGIDQYELMGKLYQMKQSKTEIDHWILISPHSNLTNTAKGMLDAFRNDFPFDIHIWTQEFNVEEFFGIDPDVFDKFFILPDEYKDDPIRNPRNWTGKYRNEIIERWLGKLPPKYRLPNGKILPGKWVENLKNPDKTLVSYSGEHYEEMIRTRQMAITDNARMCMKEDGSVVTLLSEFWKWLESEDSRILALLGEFGSGKSLHSYSLGIETAERFLKDPIHSRIPIRLTLKNCMDSNLQMVLEEQLSYMNTPYHEDFAQLNPREKVLFILDGFDEMSRYITHEMIHNRFKMIYRFCEQLKDSKILLTCRTQYFKSAEEEEEILNEIEEKNKKYKIKKLYLGKFHQKEIISCLKNRFSDFPGDEKPKEIQEKMHEGVKEIMCELSYQIYRSKDYQLSYDDLKSHLTPDKLEALKIFNKITPFTGKKEEEITEGIKTRSFLVRENDCFRFVHRSIMEYFIAMKMYQTINEEKNPGCFGAIQLSFEIIDFISDIAINKNPGDFLLKLREINFPTKRNISEERKWLGTNILSVFYAIKRTMSERGMKLPGMIEDWSGIIAPNSLLMNMDLSKTKFCEADLIESHLENADLKDSDFSNADLTNIVLGETEEIVYSKWGFGMDEHPYSIHSDGNLFKWEIKRKTPSSVLQIDKHDITAPFEICFPKNSIELFIGGELQTKKEIGAKRIQKPILLSMNNSGEYVSFYKNSIIMVFDVMNMSGLFSTLQEDVSAIYINPGGKFLAYVVSKKEVYLQDIEHSLSREIEIIENSSSVTSVAMNQEGNDIFVGFEDGEIHCYKKNNESLTWRHPIHTKAVRNISFNAVSNQLLSCGADKRISIIDAKTGERKNQLQMLLKCERMNIKGAKGLSPQKIEELLNRGAIN